MTPETNAARPEPIADAPEPEALHLIVEVGQLKEAVNEQMKIIKDHPSKDEAKAKLRAKDARIVSSLARTIERLIKSEKELEKKGAKAKAKRHAELQDSIVRKLDRFLAARGQNGVSDESKPG